MDDGKMKITTGLLGKAYTISKIIEEEGYGVGYHWCGTLVSYKEDPFTARDVVLPQSQKVSKTGLSSMGSKKEQLENLKLEAGREYETVGGIFSKGDDSIMLWFIFQNGAHYYNASADVKRDSRGGFEIMGNTEFVKLVKEDLPYDTNKLRKHIKETVEFG